MLRYGGDEFLCALVGLDEPDVRTRLAAVNANLGGSDSDSSASVTIGLAALQEGDSVETLVQRADDDLYRQRLQEDPNKAPRR